MGLKTNKPGEVPGFFALWVVDRSLCGVGVMIRAVGHRIFAEPEQGRIVGDAAERLRPFFKRKGWWIFRF